MNARVNASPAALTPTIDGYALWHRVMDYGGFTCDPDTGEIPTHGFVVSLPDCERVCARELFRPADIVPCLQCARSAAAQYPLYAVYAGAWLDEATGLVYTDASVIVSRQWRAHSLSKRFGQRSYFHLDTGKVHYLDAPDAAHTVREAS